VNIYVPSLVAEKVAITSQCPKVLDIQKTTVLIGCVFDRATLKYVVVLMKFAQVAMCRMAFIGSQYWFQHCIGMAFNNALENIYAAYITGSSSLIPLSR
jgi:hypothetical protein